MKKVLKWILFNVFGILVGDEANVSVTSDYEKNSSLSEEDIAWKRQLDLESEKYKAIQACNGCEEEVFVLIDAETKEHLSYDKNLNQLAIKNGFTKQSVYFYWKNRETRKKPYLNKYEIVNLK